MSPGRPIWSAARNDPRRRYVGFMLIVLGAILGVMLRFGGRAIDFVKAHRKPSAIAAGVLVVGLAIFGGGIVEALDGGPGVSAAMNGETERLRAMFEAGEVEPDDHGRMLCWAAQNGDVATLELLLDQGVHPDATRDDGTPAMKLACAHSDPGDHTHYVALRTWGVRPRFTLEA